VNVGKPQVSYRETLTKKVRVNYLHKKQTGGPGQKAEVELIVEPLPRGKGILFESQVVGGVIPQEYIPSVETGVRRAAESGVVADYPVVDIKVTLVGGSYHQQDSSTRAFEIAAMACLKKAMVLARPKILEPVMAVEITTPSDSVGDCIGDINQRRGVLRDQRVNGTAIVLHALLPLAEMFGYIGDLRALSSGRAVFSMQFEHYAVVPDSITANIAKA
jgi:elongation factor G